MTDLSDMLDRMDITDPRKLDYLEMERLMRRNWQHAYTPTDKQVQSMLDTHNARIPADFGGGLLPSGKQYVRLSSGRMLPKLASVGIVRKTYRRGGIRVTRYVVPGRAGLFGLSRARELFREL